MLLVLLVLMKLPETILVSDSLTLLEEDFKDGKELNLLY